MVDTPFLGSGAAMRGSSSLLRSNVLWVDVRVVKGE